MRSFLWLVLCATLLAACSGAPSTNEAPTRTAVTPSAVATASPSTASTEVPQSCGFVIPVELGTVRLQGNTGGTRVIVAFVYHGDKTATLLRIRMAEGSELDVSGLPDSKGEIGLLRLMQGSSTDDDAQRILKGAYPEYKVEWSPDREFLYPEDYPSEQPTPQTITT